MSRKLFLKWAGAALLPAGCWPWREANQFEVFVTVDQNLLHQQSIRARSLGLIVVKVPDNNIRLYRPLFSALNAAAETVKAGEVVYVSEESLRSLAHLLIDDLAE